MQQSLRRVLTAFAFFVGGADISSANTLLERDDFGTLRGPQSSETHSYQLFDPSLGTLTDITIINSFEIKETPGVSWLYSETASHQGPLIDLRSAFQR